MKWLSGVKMTCKAMSLEQKLTKVKCTIWLCFIVILSWGTQIVGQESKSWIQNLTEANSGIEPGTVTLEHHERRWLERLATHNIAQKCNVCELFTPHFIYSNTQHTYATRRCLVEVCMVVNNFRFLFHL